MTYSRKYKPKIVLVVATALSGCQSTPPKPAWSPPLSRAQPSHSSSGSTIPTESNPVQTASHLTLSGTDSFADEKDPVTQGLVKEATPTSLVQSSKETAENKRLRPAYGELVDLPIDLPTVIRLVDSNSPTVGIAQAKVREAQARLDRAEVQWLPNLTAGVAYNRFDGQTQNQRGDVFGVSRANLFAGGGPALSLDLSEAIYRPLIERQLTSAEQFRAMAVCLNAELDAVLAYFDLLQIYGSLEINAETIAKAESMLKAAEDAKDAKLDRTAGDVNRAQTEVLFRQIERMELLGRTGAASARLGKLLLLQPNVKLVPVDISVVPINLIDPNTTIDELVSSAVSHRPDLAAMRNLISAAWANVRKSEEGPRLPKLAIANQSGAYGGGLNGDLGNFDSRNALSAQIYWEVKNLGFGNQFDIAERRAMLNQTRLQLIETRARAIAEIVEVAQVAAAKYESLALAERTIEQASELYRINKEGTLNVVEAKNLFDALRPLQAIQTLNQARQGYLSSIIEFNRAQYRLYTLLGNQTNPALGS